MKQKAPKISVLGLSEELGIHRQTIKKLLVEAGLYPPHNHPRSVIIDALRPKSGDKPEDSIKEKKTFEEWRKLWLANEERQGFLIPRAEVAESVRKLAGQFTKLLDAKLENEYPAAVAGLDVPGARAFGKRLNDEIRAEVQRWADVWT